jgi:hypothetical protein
VVNCVAHEGTKLVELYNSVMDSTVVLECLDFFCFFWFNAGLNVAIRLMYSVQR